MTDTTEKTRELRRERLWSMRTSKDNPMTLAAIAKIEQVSPARIGQLIGNTGRIRSVYSRLIEIYRFIEGYNNRRRSPTLAEIAKHFPNKYGKQTSTSVITYYLDRMEELGMIEPREFMTSRSLFVLPLNKRRVEIKRILEMEAEAAKEKTDV